MRFNGLLNDMCDVVLYVLIGLVLVVGAAAGMVGALVECVWCGVKWVFKALRRLGKNDNK